MSVSRAIFASVGERRPLISEGPTPEDRHIKARITGDEGHQEFVGCRPLRSVGPDGVALADG